MSDAVSIYNAKDYGKAAPLFSQLSSNSKTPTATYYLALCYQQMHSQQQALELFKLICKHWPKSVEAKLAEDYLHRFKISVDEVTNSNGESSSKPGSKAVPVPFKTTDEPPELTKAEWDALPVKTRIPYLKEHGHMMVQAKINGRYCKVAFDSGASFCGISRPDFPDVVSPSELAKAKTGAVSRPHGLAAVKECTAEISLQDVTRKTRMFVIEEPGVSVIGQNFFQEYSYQVDDFYIRLSKSPYQTNAEKLSHKPSVADKYSIPFERFKNIMLIEVAINGHKTKVCFDTGNAADGIVSNPADWDELGLLTWGSPGRTWSRAERIDIGPITKMSVLVYPASGLVYPLIGPKLFNRPYTVDQKRQLIIFDY